MKRLTRIVLVTLTITTGMIVVGASAATAHPLGNFTSNTYAGVRVHMDSIAVDYVLDLAEIPAQQAMPSIDLDGDDVVSAGEQAAYERDMCTTLAGGVRITIGGQEASLASMGGRLTFPPGLAGLRILRLECNLEAPVGHLGRVEVHDANLGDRIGWREITAVGDGTTLSESSVAAASTSDRLRNYPSGVPALSVRDASFVARPGGPAAAAVADAPDVGTSVPGGDAATRLFASLVSDHELTIGFALVALLVAIVLGGFHAIAPGHGKTVMAAYIVGRRGGVRQAMGIGLTVAITHTIGVLILGLLLWTSETLAADRIYPVLGAASGLLVASVGLTLLVRVIRSGPTVIGHQHGTGPGQHTHDWIPELEHRLLLERERERDLVVVGAPGHPDHHDHEHHHHHEHDHHDHDQQPPPVAGRTSIIAMGLAGGMVPSPSAVIVLLGALALGRTWFGVLLVVAYGVGLALTLLLAGLLLARAQHWLEPRLERFDRTARVLGFLPVITALAVLAGGLALTARALSVI